MRTDFGKRIQEARADLEISQRELAERLAERGLKLDPSAITRIEKGTRPVRVEEAVALAAVLDTRVSELLDEDWLTPEERLADHRQAADTAMNVALTNVLEWLQRLATTQAHLREHPELVPAGFRGDSPESVEDYLPWVKARVAALGELPPIFLTSADDAGMLFEILEAALSRIEAYPGDEWARVVAERAARMREEAGDDGEHPEAPER